VEAGPSLAILVLEFDNGMRNVRTFVIASKIGTGFLQIQQCDATASPNDASSSETGD
jgi:hypothetical protein